MNLIIFCIYLTFIEGQQSSRNIPNYYESIRQSIDSLKTEKRKKDTTSDRNPYPSSIFNDQVKTENIHFL